MVARPAGAPCWLPAVEMDADQAGLAETDVGLEVATHAAAVDRQVLPHGSAVFKNLMASPQSTGSSLRNLRETATKPPDRLSTAQRNAGPILAEDCGMWTRSTSSIAVTLGTLLAFACSGRSDLQAGGGGMGGTSDGVGGVGQGGDCICDYQLGRDASVGGAGGGTTAENGTTDVDGLRACQWPATLASGDASSAGQCRAARAFVSCQDSNGGGEVCLSNDPTRCADSPQQPGVTTACQNQCAADEYGAACGSPQPSTAAFPEAPAGCRELAPTPGGIVFYCCPCVTSP
jgi:hypothetical protein